MVKQGEFNLEDVTKEDMINLADGIETFLDLMTEIMIFPDDMKSREIKEFNDAIDRVKELIELLRKGKKNKVFKEYDAWNSI